MKYFYAEILWAPVFIQDYIECLLYRAVVGTTSKHAYFTPIHVPTGLEKFHIQYNVLWNNTSQFDYKCLRKNVRKMWWCCEWRYKFDAALGELMMKGYKTAPFSCCLSQRWRFCRILSSPALQWRTCCQLWYCDLGYARTACDVARIATCKKYGRKQLCFPCSPPFPPLF